MLLQGLFVPLTCPFYPDGKSYLRKLEHNVRRYSLGPAAGLIALPPGEASALTEAERIETLKAVAETAAKKKVLIAGVHGASVFAALRQAEGAAAERFDAVLLSSPPDWARLVHGDDARELLLFYRTFADRSPLPVVLWSEQAAPSLQLPVSVVAELATHRNIIGLLDADLTVERLGVIQTSTAEIRRDVTVTTVFEAVTARMMEPEVAQGSPQPALLTVETLSAGGGTAVAAPVAPAFPVLKTRIKQVGFQVISAGETLGMLPLLQAGAAGVAPVLAAPAPQGCHEVYAAWKDGDAPLAAERAERLVAIERLIAAFGPAGVRYACDWNGFFGGHPRLPRLALTAAQRSEVERALGEIRN